MRFFATLCCALTAAAFGQTEIANEERPSGPGYTLELVEDLRFGADEAEDEYFWAMSSTKIVPDHRGHMFITDLKELRILEFDPDGKFVEVAARAGNGPGELQGIMSMASLADGRFVLLDGPPMGMPKLKYFDEDMNLVDEKLPVGFGRVPYNFRFSPKGDKFGAQYFSMDMAAGKLQLKTGVMSKDLEVIQELSSVDQKMPNMNNLADTNWTKMIAERLKTFYQGSGVYAFDNEGTPYTAVTDRYEIIKWNPEMTEPQLIIKKKHRARPNNEAHLQGYVDMIVEGMQIMPQFQSLINETMLNQALKMSEPPAFKNPLFGLIAIEDKGLIAVSELDMGTRMTVGDLFSPDGKFLGKIELGDYGLLSPDLGRFQPRMQFRNGYAYTILTDEMGDNRAVRYKYRLTPKGQARVE